MALINGGVRTGSEDESVETDFETDGEQMDDNTIKKTNWTIINRNKKKKRLSKHQEVFTHIRARNINSGYIRAVLTKNN